MANFHRAVSMSARFFRNQRTSCSSAEIRARFGTQITAFCLAFLLVTLSLAHAGVSQAGLINANDLYSSDDNVLKHYGPDGTFINSITLPSASLITSRHVMK